MALFTIKDLSFAYPVSNKNALSNVDLAINEGEFVFLIGHNGSGKSTLLKHLKPALTPIGNRTGQILFQNKPLPDLSAFDQSKRIGYIFQNSQDQIVADKVISEIAFGLESLGVDRKQMRARISEVCSYLGITDWLHTPIANLSGGQLRLVNLASVLVMEPDVIIADELPSGLDPIAAENSMQRLSMLNKDFGTTIIVSGHSLSACADRIDRVIALKDGSVIANGSLIDASRSISEKDPSLMGALPATLRIYHASVTKSSDKNAHQSKQETNLDSERPPITILDGRKWLASKITGTSVAPPNNYTTSTTTNSTTSNKDVVLKMHDVWFRYSKNERDILKGATLSIHQGEVCAIVGANASGKTTLLKCACGTLKPYRGRIKTPASSISHKKTTFSALPKAVMLPQEVRNIFSKDTVAEELHEMKRASKSPEDYFEKQLLFAIEHCDLGKLLNSHPFDLSGGEMQRLGIAKALLTNAQILLLDEPTRFLDMQSQGYLAEILKSLKEMDRSIVFATHDIDFCAECADVVTMMFDGTTGDIAEPSELFNANAYYTTDANRLSRGLISGAFTDEDVIKYVISHEK